MKRPINFKGILIPFIFLLSLLFSGLSVMAQEKEKAATGDKSLITIHINKEVNGETIQYDTTFEAYSDFDVDAFLEQKDLQHSPPRHWDNRMPGNLNFEWPGFNEHFSFFPDSIEFDTLVRRLQRTYGDIQKKLSEHQDFNWNYQFGNPDDQQFELQLKHPGNKCRPGCCPFGSRKLPGLFYEQFPGSDIEPFIGNSRPEKVIIHKKRNGKKVIITYEDEDENLKNEEIIIYRDRAGEPRPQQRHRQYRYENPDGRKQVEVQVEERSPEKNERRVIIIEKKVEEDKK